MLRLSRPALIAVSISFLFGLAPTPASAFWIWTPQKGKFERPSGAPTRKASAQFELAHGLYAAGEYDKAIREFEKFLKHYPRAPEAAEAQFFLGVSKEEKGDYYEAFLSYQEVLEKYPHSERVHEIVLREFRIANLFFKQKKRKVAGVSIPMLPSSARSQAMEIYEQVVENVPFGPHAPTAHYHIGLIFFDDEKYAQAILAFERVLEDFPLSNEVEDARFHIALSLFQLAKASEYDPNRVGAALERLEEFVGRYPESEGVARADELIVVLNEKMAEERYNIAAFYEKQNYKTSARVYYRDVLEKFPGTTWAKRAQDRLARIGDSPEAGEAVP